MNEHPISFIHSFILAMPLWFVSAHLRDQKTGKLLHAEQFVSTAPGVEMEQRSVVEEWSFGFPASSDISLDREYYANFSARAATMEECRAWIRLHPAGIAWRWLEEDIPCS